MSIEVNKGIVERGFTEFWVLTSTPLSSKLAAPDIRVIIRADGGIGLLGGIEAKATLLILERAA